MAGRRRLTASLLAWAATLACLALAAQGALVLPPPRPAAPYVLAQHLWDGGDAPAPDAARGGSDNHRLVTASVGPAADDGSTEPLRVTMSVHTNPFWAAAQGSGSAIPRPDDGTLAWELSLALFDARTARLAEARKNVAATADVAVATVVYDQGGAPAWLAVEVYYRHPWTGDDLVRFRVPIHAPLPIREPLAGARPVIDVVALVQQFCDAFQCRDSAPRLTAALRAHLRCAARLLARDDATATAAGVSPGAPGRPSSLQTHHVMAVSVVAPHPVCNARLVVEHPVTLTGLPSSGVRGAATAGEAVTDTLVAFCTAHHCASSLAQRLITSGRALVAFSSPWAGPDQQLRRLFPTTTAPVSRRAVHQLQLHAQRAMSNAHALLSHLSAEALQMPGMSSAKGRHLLNNLCSMVGTRYLEVGSFQGSTLVGCLQGNGAAVERAVAIDNFMLSRPEALEHYLKTLIDGSVPTSVINGDCFQVDVASLVTGHTRDKFNVYLYDGEHREEDHYKAFTHFADALDDVFVTLVDDWNWKEVQGGTRRAFADLGFTVLWETEVRTPTNFDEEWWNGSYLAVVAKPGAVAPPAAQTP